MASTPNGQQQSTDQSFTPVAPLRAEELRFRTPTSFTFTSTEELDKGHQGFVGQERAQAALALGLGVPSRGFNIYASGLSGIQRLDTLQGWVAPLAAQATTPGDWVYVHNFAHPDAPQAIALPTGQGSLLQHLMAELVKTLREDLPKAFRQEAFDKEKTQLREKYGTQSQTLSKEIEQQVRDQGFLLQTAPNGQFMLIPLINGKPLEKPEDFTSLSPEQQQEITSKQQEIAEEIAKFVGKQQDIFRALSADVREVERRFAEQLIAPLLTRITTQISAAPISQYVEEVKTHILEHLEAFKESAQPSAPFPFIAPGEPPPSFLEYEVNVVVDNRDTQGAPVIVEHAPTYVNLFGTIERVVDRSGRLVTNFTRIKPGAVLRAHGGYLIFNLEDALTEPAVWKTLKRTLKSGRIEMETYEPFAIFSVSGLRPAPIDVQVKVVVVGTPTLYHMLYSLDPEFHEIFKVHADFRPTMEAEGDHLRAYAQWVGELCQHEHLRHFDRAAVERLVEYGARLAGDRHKVSASYTQITNLAREAAYWATKDGARLTSAPHVQKALDERVFRTNRVEEEIRELIAQGTILVDSDGKKIGQLNGLSVLQLGEHAFGRPVRVTASVSMGQAGIVNIERESHLSGSLHDKGMLILSGYLRNRYGQDKPLTLSASICFEQSYAGIEGDSASSAELYALLSRLAEVPLRQDLAVTGSVNQWGEVQAIGGVNEKVEGFFDVCRVHGLTGTQGVLIPAANVRNLVLRADVIDAVAAGQFSVYPIRTIDEGIALLSGVRAGTVEETNTINGLVSERLRVLATALKNFLPRDRASGAGRPADDRPTRGV